MIRSLLFVVRGDETFPSSRFRAYQLREPLERLGVRVSYLRAVRSWSPSAQLPFLRELVAEAPRHDAVVYQKLLHPLHIALTRRSNENLWYDFDDAVHLTSTPGQFALTMRATRQVLAGNHELVRVAAQHGRAAQLVPTTVIMPDEPRPPDSTGPLVLSWIGSACNLPTLSPVLTAVQALRRAQLDVELEIVTEQPEQVHASQAIKVQRWSQATEVEALQRCHVGLMPLLDDAWSRGKCACKALQYLSYERPIVSSPVGVNAELFRDKPYALLASSPSDWAEAIAQLYGARSELARRGRLGREMVAQHFSVDVWAPRLRAILSRGAAHD